MEHGMHVGAVVEGIEQGSGDVADSFADDPTHGMRADGIHQRFEGNQYYQSHQAIADGFQMAMLLELAETDAGPDNGAKPYKTEESPSPIPLFAQGHQCDGGVASCNVPIDGRMVPLAELFLPLAFGRAGMIDGRGDVRTQHAEQVEPYAQLHPQVFVAVAIDEQQGAYYNAQQDSTGMGNIVGAFFSFGIFNGHNRSGFWMTGQR